jgi:hypothetical protein
MLEEDRCLRHGSVYAYGTATWTKSRLTGSLLRTAATRIMFAPDRSGAWIAQSWYQLSPGVGGKRTRRRRR